MLFNKGQLLEFGSLAPEVEICFDICLETFMGILSFDAFLTDSNYTENNLFKSYKLIILIVR